jgi:hypothetical protein
VLGAAAAERIAAEVERWPHGLSIGGYPAERWRGAAVVLGAEKDDDLAEDELRPADPPPELAQEVEPVVPPLRPIELSSAESGNSQDPRANLTHRTLPADG